MRSLCFFFYENKKLNHLLFEWNKTYNLQYLNVQILFTDLIIFPVSYTKYVSWKHNLVKFFWQITVIKKYLKWWDKAKCINLLVKIYFFSFKVISIDCDPHLRTFFYSHQNLLYLLNQWAQNGDHKKAFSTVEIRSYTMLYQINMVLIKPYFLIVGLYG